MYITTKIVSLSELKELSDEAIRQNWDLVIDETWGGDYDRVAIFQRLEDNN